ncbi:hypothetical protein M0Q28_01755 [Patescibacteria group bacterium]|jgi:hypothetical protein|nr:hypothetical protein [Patescibacteria group bacterium]
MRTRQSYCNEIIAYIDAFIGAPYTAELHDVIVRGFCAQHRAKLNEEIPSDGLQPAVEVGKMLMLRAAGITTIPTPGVWQLDSELKERFVAVYTTFLWRWINDEGQDGLPGRFQSTGAARGSDDPFLN